jgi:hypothetical protein
MAILPILPSWRKKETPMSHHDHASLPPAAQALLAQTAAAQPVCLLCGAAVYRVALFLPGDPHVWGFAPGWEGGAAYALCKGCVRLPDLEARVTTILWADRHRVAAPWN